VLSEVPSSLSSAHQVIITKIFASREPDPGDFTGLDIANVIPKAQYLPESPSVINYLKSNVHSSDVILIMGSGDSSKLAHQILDSLTTSSSRTQT
jgi:UDP-N-acetylmuramate-alanine ligase